MAKLQDIVYGVTLRSFEGNRDLVITGVTADSREVQKGFLFVAVKGLTVDGHNYIVSAIEKGAVAVIYEDDYTADTQGVTFIKTDSSSIALGIAAANFYGNPSTRLKLIGVTGTNGKTTTVTLLHELFQSMGYSAGLLSTVENKIGDTVTEATHTTPDSVQLNRLLAQMVEKGCTHAFMEVSSHALVQHRVAGVRFSGAVFTNISHDHLDYHQTFDAYIAAKKLLFDGLPAGAFALVNADDKRGAIMLQNTKAGKHKMAIRSVAGFKARIIQNTLQGLELEIDGINVWFKLIGSFNAYNLLTAYSVATLLGEDSNEVLTQMSQLNGARGRFEYIVNPNKVIAIVDYAHTPDALENVLETIDDLRTKNEMVITVVGCGGNRDRDKRPKMAEIAQRYSDKVILTSDNPRNEDPQAILNDMLAGVPKSAQRKVMSILDRREAIRTACNLAGEQDILLVAGKGHETYQEVMGVRSHFDDKEVLNEMLSVK